MKGLTLIEPMACGTIIRPAASGDQPQPICRNSTSSRYMPDTPRRVNRLPASDTQTLRTFKQREVAHREWSVRRLWRT